MSDPIADAQAWYDRAQVHITEYQSLAYSEDERIWTLHREQTGQDVFSYSLRLTRDLLSRLTPLAGEAANALFHSLDNIVGVAARVANVERSPQISWPWKIEPDTESSLSGAVRPAIDKKLKEMGKLGIPEQWLTAIRDVTFAQGIGLSHIDIVKEVSLSGKHWELVATGADAMAIGWTPTGAQQQVIVQIPREHFTINNDYVFHQGERITVNGFEIVTGTILVVPSKSFTTEPITAFQYTSRFVDAAIGKARSLLAT